MYGSVVVCVDFQLLFSTYSLVGEGGVGGVAVDVHDEVEAALAWVLPYVIAYAFGPGDDALRSERTNEEEG